MRYVSTRGGCAPMPFTEAVLTGLAADGGLLLPEQFPSIVEELPSWRDLSFTEIAQRIFKLYVDDIPSDCLDALLADAFATFDHPQVAPLVDLEEFQVLELFHGPTLSFKDVALQVLGRLFEHILSRSGGRLNIVGATSGDTGSAAIHGVRGRDNINIFMLYPNGRISPLQELQMTTVPDANVHCLAIDGSFDDCQSIVKGLFGDLPFKERYNLGAVNSMNWARVLTQMTYYVHTSLQSEAPPMIAVPTGNFGNIFAGIAVWRMGVPIEQLVLATNDNDILVRLFQTGIYQRGPVSHTISPSMDIQVASNFERFLYLCYGGDAARVRAFMAQFAETDKARLEMRVDGGIVATAIDEEETYAIIRDTHHRLGYVVDPHTAVGIAAARQADSTRMDLDDPPICIATAHPAKFPVAVSKATGGHVPRHPTLDGLDPAAARRTMLPASQEAVADYVRRWAC